MRKFREAATFPRRVSREGLPGRTDAADGRQELRGPLFAPGDILRGTKFRPIHDAPSKFEATCELATRELAATDLDAAVREAGQKSPRAPLRNIRKISRRARFIG